MVTQTMETRASGTEDTPLGIGDTPGPVLLHKIKEYFRGKLLNGSDPLVNDPTQRTQKNINRIIRRILEEMKRDNDYRDKGPCFVPSRIFLERKNKKGYPLTWVFYRDRREYTKDPDLILKDLSIYQTYYEKNDLVYVNPMKENNQATEGRVEEDDMIENMDPILREAIEVTLRNTNDHSIQGKPKVSDFMVTPSGIIRYIGKNHHGIDYSGILAKVQMTYEELNN